MLKLFFKCIVVLLLIIENIMDFVVKLVYKIRCLLKKIIGIGIYIMV